MPWMTDGHGEEQNNGEDVTRPVTRFDMRLKYQQGVNNNNGESVILTARTDQVIPLSYNWQLATRADLPHEWFLCSGNTDSGPCIKTNRFGDSLFQILLITPTCCKWTCAFGAQIIFPTAGNNLEVGQGKYQLLPTIAFRNDLENWSPGAYCGILFRHSFDFAGYKNAPHISQTYIQPFLNVNLPQQWFLNSSPELRYNWMTNRWFIPLDLMIGKMLTPKTVISLEYEYALLADYQLYTQQLELRIGFFF